MCISELPHSYSLSLQIMIFMCITEYKVLVTSGICTHSLSLLPHESPIVHIYSFSILIIWTPHYISMFTQLASPGTSPSALEYHVQPDWEFDKIYVNKNRQCILYYNVINHLGIVKHRCWTKTTMMNNISCSYGFLKTTTVRILHRVHSLLQTIYRSLRWSHGLQQICADISAAAECDDPWCLIS